MKNKSLSILFLVITMSLAAQTPAYVPINGLVGWWPFTGNGNDLSGNGNHGAVYGSALTTDRFGVANNAYSFDGIDDYIQLNSITQIPNQNDYTWSFWGSLLSSPKSSDTITEKKS